jgi:ABC-2 type transport system ATP-binding protein
MPPNLTLQSVSKTFGRKLAVAELSFDVEPGEILGLLGPNGAGKTTTLRMALDLIKPDAGRIELFGAPLTERAKDRLGYMPENAALYADMRLCDCLVYLATLKSLSTRDAKARVDAELRRMGLEADRKKKLRQLSRGMYQKAQIIAATLHDPDLLIVDEPFANLDPVNAQIIKATLLDFRARGKSLIMSSHQMHLVEELCDRIVMLQAGRRVLYGPMRAIQQQFAEPAVWVAGQGAFAGLPGVAGAESFPKGWKLTLAPGAAPADLLRALAARPEMSVDRFELALPSLDEIFIRLAGPDGHDGREGGPHA